MVSASVPSQSNIKPLIFIERGEVETPESTLKRRQLIFEVAGHQRLDQGIEIAVDHIRKIVEREFDAVISDAVLRKVVGADALVAFAGADLRLALRGVFGIFL